MNQFTATPAWRNDQSFGVDCNYGDDSSLPMLQHLGDCGVFRAKSKAAIGINANPGKYLARSREQRRSDPARGAIFGTFKAAYHFKRFSLEHIGVELHGM